MKIVNMCIALSLLTMAIFAQTGNGRVGYVYDIEMTEKDSVLLVRGEKAHQSLTDRADVRITPKSAHKRIFVYKGDQFILTGKPEVSYYSPAPTTAINRVKVVYVAEPQASKSSGGSRPQNGPDDIAHAKTLGANPQFLFGEKKDDYLYIPVEGTFDVVWYNPSSCQPISIQVLQDGKRLLSESIPSGAVFKEAPIGVFRSEKLASVLRTAAFESSGAEIVLSIAFDLPTRSKSIKVLSSKFHLTTASASRGINPYRRDWKEAKSFIPLENLNEYWLALEKENCGMECSARLVDWWRKDTNNYAANAALHSLALRSECKPLIRILRIKTESEEGSDAKRHQSR